MHSPRAHLDPQEGLQPQPANGDEGHPGTCRREEDGVRRVRPRWAAPQGPRPIVSEGQRVQKSRPRAVVVEHPPVVQPQPPDQHPREQREVLDQAAATCKCESKRHQDNSKNLDPLSPPRNALWYGHCRTSSLLLWGCQNRCPVSLDKTTIQRGCALSLAPYCKPHCNSEKLQGKVEGEDTMSFIVP